MIATSFTESNFALSAPDDMKDSCDALSVLRMTTPAGDPRVISCWKLTVEELALINKTGRVYLTVCGVTMPPVMLTVDKPFESEDSAPSQKER